MQHLKFIYKNCNLIAKNGFIAFIFFGIYQKEGIHFEVNKLPTVAGLGNLGSIFMPVLMIIIFSSFGLGMLGTGIYSLFKKGGYFVGTPTRLVNYQKGNIRSIDWEQFSGDIGVTGNYQKGNISLQMRTGRMVSKKRGHDYYVPDVIYISGIPNVFEIEQICRKRIKENDPAPQTAGQNIT